ncbi:MAG TPA: DEAD/DEAH box helicase [Bacillota bacterium]|nr:DEAD/DEAH box helicase [Bacillota bacterium]HOK68770.1 DEAD/DEAH box helicase [Bacillota bacterium]HPP85765.1 DEAD/DEAH box helicase [Bacillota bacterium]
MAAFEELGIIPEILASLKEMGFAQPTEVQSRAIPHVLEKKDMIVQSKTGSGKTAVFGIPILQLTDMDAKEPQALILTPTRELAVQIDNDIRRMASHLRHKTAVVYGQHNINTEIKALNEGVAILTGTPGRVYDHISHGTLKTQNIRFLVMDEADRMLDMGFIDQVRRIIRALPKNRVMLLFSATMPPEIRRICTSYMKNPVNIVIESQTMTVDTIQQIYYRVKENEKCDQLNRVLLHYRPESCIIFCNTKIAADMVQHYLTRKGYHSHVLHGDVPQGKRLQTIQNFKQNKFHILVATDVAARGLDINDLAMVINFDIPEDKDNYVHRIGRTGRAGKGGVAVSLATTNDIMDLYAIEEHIGVLINQEELPADENIEAEKESVENWIAQNRLKEKEAPEEKKAARKNAKNRSRSNRKKEGGKPEQKKKENDGKSVGKSEGKSEKRPSAVKHDGKKPHGKAQNTANRRPSPERTPAVQTPPAAEVQTAEPEKKTFLQRLAEKLFGKKKK